MGNRSFVRLTEGAIAVVAMMAASSALNAQVRGEGVPANKAATTQFQKGKAAEKAKKDKEAVQAYEAALKASPRMLEALNNLTYLQATSTDPSVRNPRAALTNAGKLLDMYYQEFINRRTSGRANRQRLPASFYRVVVLNTWTAAFAANGRFDTTPSTLLRSNGNNGCATGGGVISVAANEEARALEVKSPTAVSRENAKITDANMQAAENHKPIEGVPQPAVQ
jgi:hypothetical protein